MSLLIRLHLLIYPPSQKKRKRLAINGGKRVVPKEMIKKLPRITKEDKKVVLEVLDNADKYNEFFRESSG